MLQRGHRRYLRVRCCAVGNAVVSGRRVRPARAFRGHRFARCACCRGREVLARVSQGRARIAVTPARSPAMSVRAAAMAAALRVGRRGAGRPARRRRGNARATRGDVSSGARGAAAARSWLGQAWPRYERGYPREVTGAAPEREGLSSRGAGPVPRRRQSTRRCRVAARAGAFRLAWRVRPNSAVTC